MTIETHTENGRQAMGGLDWGLGRYEPTAEQLAPAAVLAVDRAAPTPGEVVLDVGCGTGNAALIAVAKGAKVIGVDPAPRLLEVAAERAAADGREVALIEGVAEALPVPDASIDVVLSLFGVIFATDPRAAAAELARVMSPAGRIVLTAWLPGGALAEIAGISRAAVMRAIGADASAGFAWHDRDALEQLFRPHGLSVELEEASLVHRAPSLDEYLRTEFDVHPLAVAGMAILERSGEAESLRARQRAMLAQANEDPAGFAVTSRYVVVVARPAS